MTHFLGLALAVVIRYFLYLLEALAVLVLIRIAANSGGGKWLAKATGAFRQLACRRGSAVLAVGVLPVAIRAVLLPILPPRLPQVPDEFAYLLAGETFSLGRLANAPHTLWVHFESLHILQQPTYMSMYSAAQGVFLAAGKVITGNLWAGVWLSAGLMCAAICWMLQAWFPPSWALLGGTIAALRLGLFGYWMNSYFGGAAPALGGALVLGALPRVIRKQRLRDIAFLALGLTVLANSRPYEGLFLSLPAVIALGLWIFGTKGPPAQVSILRVIAPLCLLLAATGAATSYYYRRVTGSPFQVPQVLQREQYAVAPYFMWQSPKTGVVFRHEGLRAFYAGAEMDYYRETRSMVGWLETSLFKIRDFWLFYLGPVLTLPLGALPWILRDKRIRFLLITGGIFLVGLAAEVWFYPHYAAPATALLYAVLLQSMRHLRVWKWRGRRSGKLLVRGIPVICGAMVLARLGAESLHFPAPPDFPMTWCYVRPGGLYRAEILARLSAQGNKHLILVRWQPGDSPFDHWVYNEPDIDKATVVWAWEDNPADLLQYYPDRQVWLLRPAVLGPPTLSAYPRPTVR